MARILTAVAWPYANGPRHIGHVSGFGVPSDVFSRFMRMSGHDVLMVSGTDEHGTPIGVQAEREGLAKAAGANPGDCVFFGAGRPAPARALLGFALAELGVGVEGAVLVDGSGLGEGSRVPAAALSGVVAAAGVAGIATPGSSR